MWYQLFIKNCPNEALETLSEWLEEKGALSILLTDKNDDPILEPAPGTTPLWPEVMLQALFNEEEKAMLAQAELAYESTMAILADQDWERVWMDDFKPIVFGDRLTICPSWSAPPNPDGINLMLDPGLAFGTGSHQTTALCLTWLAQTDLFDKHCIDFGCGSGILALAALKLGAHHVFAVDIDPQALLATKDNAEKNTIPEEKLTCGLPDILTNNQDLIIANILLQPLLSLYPYFHQLLHTNGTLVVSGLLKEQVPTMIETCQNVFLHKKTMFQDNWALIEFSRL